MKLAWGFELIRKSKYMKNMWLFIQVDSPFWLALIPWLILDYSHILRNTRLCKMSILNHSNIVVISCISSNFNRLQKKKEIVVVVVIVKELPPFSFQIKAICLLKIRRTSETSLAFGMNITNNIFFAYHEYPAY